MFYSSSSFALFLLFILPFWLVCWFTSHSIHSPSPPPLSLILHSCSCFLILRVEGCAVNLQLSRTPWSDRWPLTRSNTIQHMLQMKKKGTELNRVHKWPKKNMPNMYESNVFWGGWGLVHDDTISWISPVLKYEHKVWTKERKETIYPTGIMGMIMVKKHWVQITLN